MSSSDKIYNEICQPTFQIARHLREKTKSLQPNDNKKIHPSHILCALLNQQLNCFPWKRTMFNCCVNKIPTNLVFHHSATQIQLQANKLFHYKLMMHIHNEQSTDTVYSSLFVFLFVFCIILHYSTPEAYNKYGNVIPILCFTTHISRCTLFHIASSQLYIVFKSLISS